MVITLVRCFFEKRSKPCTLSLQYYENEFTLWDRFEVNGRKEDGSEMTLQELFDLFQVYFERPICTKNIVLIVWFFSVDDFRPSKFAMYFGYQRAVYGSL